MDCFFLWGVVLNKSRGLRDWSFHDFGILEYIEHAIGRYGNLTVTGAIHFQDPVYAIHP